MEGSGRKAQGDDYQYSYRVMVANNVTIEEEGEYFVRGIIVDNSGTKVSNFDQHCIFSGSREKLADREILVGDSIIKNDEGWILVRLMLLEGRTVLHTGTTLGYVEGLKTIENNENLNIRRVSLMETRIDETKINQILKDIADNVSEKINSKDKDQLMKLLRMNKDVFSQHKYDIGKANLVEHGIDTEKCKPIAFRPRKIPLGLEKDVDRMVDELLKENIIKPSNSPWNFPLVVVRKKNGDIRMCVDYRALNAKTSRPIFPIPSSEELFDTLGGSKYFSSLDLSSGYYQVPMKETDQEKTAFNTKRGQYEFTRMPFGLCSAPATFQRLMNMVLRKENWSKCVVYLDDILIFGHTITEHNERLNEVLMRIRDAGLKLSPSKCHFLKTEINYLGHIIDGNGVRTDPAKIKCIKEWILPSCTKELQTFLGFCNYYRRFIKDYALTSEKLSGMLKGENKFIWNDERKAAFYELKERLLSPPLLSLPTQDGQYILDTDASQNSIGAVLSQIQEGEEKVLSYASKSMTKSERMYCITRKELLAIYIFTRKFKHYLLGRKFIVRTDHQALKWLLKWDNPNTSQYCVWRAELEIFDMEVQYRKGEDHVNADALSRLPPCEQCLIKHTDPKKKRNVRVQTWNYDDKKSVESQSEKVLCRVVNDDYDQDQEKDTELKVILELLKNSDIRNNTKHKEIENGNDNIKAIWKKRQNLRIRGDLLYLYSRGNYRLIVPKLKRIELIRQIHRNLGHVGMEKTLDILRGNYYWPTMADDVYTEIGFCKECNHNKYINGRIRAPLQHITATEPFQIVGIDVTGPLKATKEGYRFILGVIDYFTKYICLIPMRNMEAETVARLIFKEWISKFGAPERIHTDCGTNFESNFFKEYCRILGIKKTTTSPYYPQSDGLAERLFRTSKCMISAVMDDKQIRDWSEVIPTVEMGLRATKQKTTGFTPHELVFGRKMCLARETNPIRNGTSIPPHKFLEQLKETLKVLRIKARANTERTNRKIDKDFDKGKWNDEVKVGDRVLVKNQHISGFDQKYFGPFTVIKRIDKWTFILRDKNNKTIQRNYNQIKVVKRRTGDSETWGTSICLKSCRFPDTDEKFDGERGQTRPDDTPENERRYPIRENRNRKPARFR